MRINITYQQALARKDYLKAKAKQLQIKTANPKQSKSNLFLAKLMRVLKLL